MGVQHSNTSTYSPRTGAGDVRTNTSYELHRRGWEQTVDAEGKTYYTNRFTGESTYFITKAQGGAREPTLSNGQNFIEAPKYAEH